RLEAYKPEYNDRNYAFWFVPYWTSFVDKNTVHESGFRSAAYPMRDLRENGSEATAQNVHRVSRPAEARRARASLPVIVKLILDFKGPTILYVEQESPIKKH
ncbi:hypothetical protein, partial [Microbulbifer agarilyticus]|uniref:hypothetical protein n=1 Tax=Microbulbifer agarilyticus TaxID=260552 RepID=UPI001CD51179